MWKVEMQCLFFWQVLTNTVRSTSSR